MEDAVPGLAIPSARNPHFTEKVAEPQKSLASGEETRGHRGAGPPTSSSRAGLRADLGSSTHPRHLRPPA